MMFTVTRKKELKVQMVAKGMIRTKGQRNEQPDKQTENIHKNKLQQRGKK